MHHFYRCLLLCGFFLLANDAIAFIYFETGEFSLNCGYRQVNVEYRTSVDKRSLFTTNFAMLIDGSPLIKYFTDNTGNYQNIGKLLLKKGYKLLEIKYPDQTLPLEDFGEARGFYVACLNQGMDAISKHSADLYEAIIKVLNYDQKNHRLVGLGFSIGAVILQSMAFTQGKKFDNLALTGILLGDVANGYILGHKQRKQISLVGKTLSLEEYYSQKELFDGTSWASFIHLADQVRKKDSVDIEFNTDLNFENQRFYTASNLAMFEGNKTKINPYSFGQKEAANPAQVRYIADKRSIQRAPTQTFFYDNCYHSVINCGKNIVNDIVSFLVR